MSRIYPAVTPDPEDRYTPEELRHLDSMLLYPGEDHIFSARGGISPRGGVAAQISGSTVTVRDMVGVISPTGSPWTASNGSYRFVLYQTVLSADPAHSSQDRQDLLVARLTDQEIDSSGTRMAEAVIITGTPGAGVPPDPEAGDLHLSTITVPAGGGTTSITPSGLYTVGMGGVNTYPSEAAFPSSGTYSGQAAYAQTERLLSIARAGTWRPMASESMFEFFSAISNLAVSTASGQATANNDTLSPLTGGPNVTLDVPASGRVLVIWGGRVAFSASTSTPLARWRIQCSGANSVVISGTSTTWSVRQNTGDSGSNYQSCFSVWLESGLTAGSTTFTSQYAITTGSATFDYRQLVVIPL